MRIGTPGFVAATLTEAREARGLTQTSLAERTGIKAQSICHYEQGRQSPSPEALHLLCTALAVPMRFFLRSGLSHNTCGIVFAGADRTQRAQGERRLGWLKDLTTYIARYIDLPPVTLPRLSGHPEDAANDVRRILGIGLEPVGSVPALLERLGCIVSSAGVPLSQWDGDRPWAIPGSARQLGHLVMDVPDEAQADRFARAFLLPAATFTPDVWAPTAEALFTLRSEWRCPLRMMIHRCEDLGIFTPPQARRAVMKLNRRGWNDEETDETSVPTLLARSVRLAIDSGARDRHTLLHDLGLNGEDVEEIAGLPHGFLSAPASGSIPELRLREESRIFI